MRITITGKWCTSCPVAGGPSGFAAPAPSIQWHQSNMESGLSGIFPGTSKLKSLLEHLLSRPRLSALEEAQDMLTIMIIKAARHT
jgi:hypothetical protein